jgi:hypothetical protein
MRWFAQFVRYAGIRPSFDAGIRPSFAAGNRICLAALIVQDRGRRRPGGPHLKSIVHANPIVAWERKSFSKWLFITTTSPDLLNPCATSPQTVQLPSARRRAFAQG